MFDSEHHHVAARIIDRAEGGMRADQLMDAVREEFPNMPTRSIARAAFIAVTRPSVSPDALRSIHEMAMSARRPHLNETVDI